MLLYFPRARITIACDFMRKLVPGLSDKTDKATVFEYAARYIHFLNAQVGKEYDAVSLFIYIYLFLILTCLLLINSSVFPKHTLLLLLHSHSALQS